MMRTSITYLIGDATRPVGAGPKIIAHVCNDVGAWGAGFVLAISHRWSKPEAQYRSWHAAGEWFELGMVQFVSVESDIIVANMIAQTGFVGRMVGIPLRYDALAKCLAEVARRAKATGASVHMPRIGCGLACGQWSDVEPLIIEHLCQAGVAVTVYDLEQ